MNELLFGPPVDLSVHDINPGGDINLVSPVMDKSWLNTTPQEQAPTTAKKLQEDKDKVTARNMFEDFTKRNSKEIAMNTKTQQLYTPYSQARKFEGFQDEGLYFNPDDEYLDDVYRGAQGPLDRIGNYVAQTLGNAAASFAGSFLEIPSVIAAANATAGSDKTDVLGKLADGYRALWDNPLVASIDEANKKWQDHFYNFSTEGERKNPFWGKILTGSLLGEMVASSGMALGAIAGAIVETAAVGLATGGVGDVPLFALKAKKFVDYVPELLESLVKANKVINATGDTYQNARSIFNTTKNLTGNIDFAYKSTKLADKMFSVNMITNNFYEGALEARQAVEELKGTLAEQYKAKTGYDPDGEELKKIEDQANKAGNMVFGANVALLALTNKFEFGDLVRRSQIGEVAYKAEKNKIADLAIDGIDGIKSNQKAVKAVTTAADPLKPSNFLSKTSNFVKNRVSTSLIRESLGEGLEEGAQMSIENFSQDYYAHNYTDAAYNVANAIGRAVGKTLTSQEGWASILSGIGSGALTSGGLQLAGVQQKDVPVDAATAALHIAQLSSSGKLSDLVARKASSKVAGGTKAGSIQSEAIRVVTELEKQKSVEMDIYNWANTAQSLGYGDIRKQQIAEARKLEGENFKLAFGIEYNDKNKAIVNETLDNVSKLYDKSTKALDKVNVVYKNPYDNKKEPGNHRDFEQYKKELAYHLYNNDNNLELIKTYQQSISAMDGSIGFGEELTSLTNGKTEFITGIVDGRIQGAFGINKGTKFGLPVLKEGYEKELKDLQALIAAGITEPRTTKKVKDLQDLIERIDKHIASDNITEQDKVELIHDIRGMNTRYDDAEEPDGLDSFLIKNLLDKIDQTRALLERSAGIINALNGKTGFDKFKSQNNMVRQATVDRITEREATAKKAAEEASKQKSPETKAPVVNKTTEQEAKDKASTTAKNAFTDSEEEEMSTADMAEALESSTDPVGKIVIIRHNKKYQKVIAFNAETSKGFFFQTLLPDGTKQVVKLTKKEVETRYKNLGKALDERYEDLYFQAVEEAKEKALADATSPAPVVQSTPATPEEPAVITEPIVEPEEVVVPEPIVEAPIPVTIIPQETIDRNPIDILEPQDDVEETPETEEKEIPDGLAFNLKGGVKAVFNRRTKGFDFYTKKGNKVKSHVKMKKYSKELASKPNMIQSWWNDLIDESTKEDVLYHLRELMDQYQQGMNDAEAVIDLEGLIMQNIKGAKFTPGQIDGYVTDVDRGRWVSDTGGTPLDTFVTGTLQDILRDNGFDMDESEIIEAVLSIIQSYPKGISAQSLKDHLESTDPMRMVYAIQDTFLDRFGLDIDQVLTRLQQELTDAEQATTNEPESQDQADIATVERDIQEAESVIPTETGEELLLDTTVVGPIEEEPVGLDNEEEIPDNENPLFISSGGKEDTKVLQEFLIETGSVSYQEAFYTFKEEGMINPYEFLLKIHNRNKELAKNVWDMIGNNTMDEIKQSISAVKTVYENDPTVTGPLALIKEYNNSNTSKERKAKILTSLQQNQFDRNQLGLKVYNIRSENNLQLFFTDKDNNRKPLGYLYQGNNFVYLSRLDKIVNFETIFDEVDVFTEQDFKDMGVRPNQESVLRTAIVAYKKSNEVIRDLLYEGDITNEDLSQYYDWGFFENTALLTQPFSKPHFVRENAISTVEVDSFDKNGNFKGSSRKPMIFDVKGAFYQNSQGFVPLDPKLSTGELAYYNQVILDIQNDPALRERIEAQNARFVMITSYRTSTAPGAKLKYTVVALRPASLIASNTTPFDVLNNYFNTVQDGFVTDKDLFYIADGENKVVYDMRLDSKGLSVVPKDGIKFKSLFNNPLRIPRKTIEFINGSKLTEEQKYQALLNEINKLITTNAADLVTNKVNISPQQLHIKLEQLKAKIPTKNEGQLLNDYQNLFYSSFAFEHAGLVTMSQPKLSPDDYARLGTRVTVLKTDNEKRQEEINTEVADPIEATLDTALTEEPVASDISLEGLTADEAHAVIQTLIIQQRASLSQRMTPLTATLINSVNNEELAKAKEAYEAIVSEVEELDSKTYDMIAENGNLQDYEQYKDLIVSESEGYLDLEKAMNNNRYKFQQSSSAELDNLPFMLYDGASIDTLVDKFKRECK